jgi:hypothetical protein
MYGTARLLADLEALGYEPEELKAPDGTPFVVMRKFVVPCGRFVDRRIELGIQPTPDFPRTVASAIHVRANPQLFEYSDSQPNVRNIAASALGPEWRYWSHNFGWQEERSARRLMSQVNRIFANA